jgi:hypothetical protein
VLLSGWNLNKNNNCCCFREKKVVDTFDRFSKSLVWKCKILIAKLKLSGNFRSLIFHCGIQQFQTKFILCFQWECTHLRISIADKLSKPDLFTPDIPIGITVSRSEPNRKNRNIIIYNPLVDCGALPYNASLDHKYLCENNLSTGNLQPFHFFSTGKLFWSNIDNIFYFANIKRFSVYFASQNDRKS